jgi:shikimate dehydrogenase
MTTIKGTTRLAAVIGNPLTHTLSPAMHNAAYEELGLDWAYVPIQVQDETGLRRLLAAAPALSFVGFNITMPYKQAVLDLCDQVAAAASMAGAVNTIHCTDNGLVGYNTDGRGLLESLDSEAGLNVSGTEVVLLGSGGAAGAAFVAFILARAAKVTVVSRNQASAAALVDRMAAHLGCVEARACSFDDAPAAIASASLVVNATPLGMAPDDPSPIAAGLVGPGQVVYDLVYGRIAPTALVRESSAAGALALDGLGMLVAQGAIAIDIWDATSQRRAPRQTMRRAAEQELASRVETAR